VKNMIKNKKLETKKLVEVSPRISVFMGTVASREGRDELAENHAAERSAIKASVQLLPKHLQKSLRGHTNGIRDLILRYSIPYGNGNRIMKVANYPMLEKELNKKVAAYKIFVQDNVIANYDSLVSMAQIKLNGLYRDDMFPSKESLAYKYGAHITVKPMTDTDKVSFVIEGLEQAKVDEIRENLKREIEANLREGQKRVISELKRDLMNIFDKTQKKDGENARYKAAVRSLLEKADNVKNTNILEIPELTKTANDIHEKFSKVTSSAVKANGEKATKKIGEDASNLIDALDAINF